jgi:cation diffusion facilitator family transporter
MGPRKRSKSVIYAALVGNLLVASIKFAAAFFTGSSAMLSEAIHSLVDTGDQAILLYGIHRAAKPPDQNHPLGHGRELYFWSFVVALLIFTIGAGVTLFEGVSHIRNPHPIENVTVSYAVIAASMVFEGATWTFALRSFRKSCGDIGILEAVRRSKDPPAFIVLFEDSAALLGLMIALIGTFATQYFNAPVIDGIASVAISVLLAAVAILLARESKALLIGEPATPGMREAILKIVRSIPGVENAQVMFTVHLAPDQIVAALNVEFADGLQTPEIEKKTVELESALREQRPELIALFIKPRAVGSGATARLSDGVPAPVPASKPLRQTG